MTIGAVIFDFGNVLVGWEPDRLYRRLIPDPVQRSDFLRNVCSPAWNLEQDRGRPWDEAIAELVSAYPGQASLIRAFRDNWDEMVTGPVAEGNDILERVTAAGIPAYGLTNWSAETYDRSAHHLPFLGHFRYVAVSGRLGMVKPEPGIFLHLLERIGLPPEECAFIDDNAANVAAARELGIRALEFRNDGTALDGLRRMGLGI